MPGAIIVIGLVLYPYVYLSGADHVPVPERRSCGEAARTLGAGRWTIFWRVSLPMARPALAVGVALVSLETLNDIGASEYLGVRTLTVSIFTTWLNRGSLAGAAQLSCFMLAVVAGLIALERYGRRNTRRRVLRRKSAADAADAGCPGSGAGGVRGCACCRVLLGFVVPVLFLRSRGPAAGGIGESTSALVRDAFHSIALATLRHADRADARLSPSTSGLRWRRPGAVHRDRSSVADSATRCPASCWRSGLLTPLVAVDNGLNAAGRGLGRPRRA